MTRTPKYHDKHPVRIVSRPNGLWAVQFYVGVLEFKSNEVDPWEDFLGASKLEYNDATVRFNAEAARLG